MYQRVSISFDYILNKVESAYAEEVSNFVNSGLVSLCNLKDLKNKGVNKSALAIFTVFVFVVSREDVLEDFGGDIHSAVCSILGISEFTYRNQLLDAKNRLEFDSTFGMFVSCFFKLAGGSVSEYVPSNEDVFVHNRVIQLFESFDVVDSSVLYYFMLSIKFGWVSWGVYFRLVEEFGLNRYEEVLLWVLIVLPCDDFFTNRYAARVLNWNESYAGKKIESLYSKLNVLIPGKNVDIRSRPLMLFTALLHYGLFTSSYLQGVEEEVVEMEG